MYFNLKIVSRDGVIYEDQVISITSYNEVGKFDILAQHSNFISLIQKNIVIQDKGMQFKEIPLDNALIKVFENNATIYIGVDQLGFQR